MQHRFLLLAFAGLAVLPGSSIAADPGQNVDLVISPGSVRAGGIELRQGPRQDDTRYFSLAATQRALGRPSDRQRMGLGILVYAWRGWGIHLQRGWRGPERGKYFKMQIWFCDDYDRVADKHSGVFSGHLKVDGFDLTAGNRFGQIRSELEKADYQFITVGAYTYAEKGEIRILPTMTGDEIWRVEVWSEPFASIQRERTKS